jgi:hypothetical protein
MAFPAPMTVAFKELNGPATVTITLATADLTPEAASNLERLVRDSGIDQAVDRKGPDGEAFDAFTLIERETARATRAIVIAVTREGAPSCSVRFGAGAIAFQTPSMQALVAFLCGRAAPVLPPS